MIKCKHNTGLFIKSSYMNQVNSLKTAGNTSALKKSLTSKRADIFKCTLIKKWKLSQTELSHINQWNALEWIQHIIIAITTTSLFSITISVQVLPIKKSKLNYIKIENKNKINKIIGSLRYHDGDGHENVA